MRSHQLSPRRASLRLALVIATATLLSAAGIASQAEAATPTTKVSANPSAKAAPKPSAQIGAPCLTAGATTKVGAKTLTCAKALSGKLVWGSTVGAAPSLSGGRSGEDDGPNGGGPDADPAFAAAMAKYTSCLAKEGVTLPAFGGRRGFGGPDDDHQGAAAAPTLSAKEQKAMTKCASLRPAFKGFRGPEGDIGGGLPNTPTNVSAYIACLNTNGVNVASLADLQGLDRQSLKVSSALSACRAKRVAMAPPTGARPAPTKSN